MVIKLIEGETLAARIEKGPIPLEQAIAYAIQIADAMDRAHRAGVTLRDIKSGNIMLTRDGVKVLDFGLAKSTAKPEPTEATLTKALTSQGTVLGTPSTWLRSGLRGKRRTDGETFGQRVRNRKGWKMRHSLKNPAIADPARVSVSLRRLLNTTFGNGSGQSRSVCGSVQPLLRQPDVQFPPCPDE